MESKIQLHSTSLEGKAFYKVSLFSVKKIEVFGVTGFNYGEFIVYENTEPRYVLITLGSFSGGALEVINQTCSEHSIPIYNYLKHFIHYSTKGLLSIEPKYRGGIFIPNVFKRSFNKDFELPVLNIDFWWDKFSEQEKELILKKSKKES